MPLTRPERPIDLPEMVKLSDFVGQPIAIKLLEIKVIESTYGRTPVSVVDLLTLDGEYYPELLCFWKAFREQLDDYPEEWLAGKIVKDGVYYVFDGAGITDADSNRIEAHLIAFEETAPNE